jgi:hypothetical protein
LTIVLPLTGRLRRRTAWCASISSCCAASDASFSGGSWRASRSISGPGPVARFRAHIWRGGGSVETRTGRATVGPLKRVGWTVAETLADSCVDVISVRQTRPRPHGRFQARSTAGGCRSPHGCPPSHPKGTYLCGRSADAPRPRHRRVQRLGRLPTCLSPKFRRSASVSASVCCLAHCGPVACLTVARRLARSMSDAGSDRGQPSETP